MTIIVANPESLGALMRVTALLHQPIFFLTG